jgi:hypothetical protein
LKETTRKLQGLWNNFCLARPASRIAVETQVQLMLKTIKGIYQDGQIQLTEPPQNVGEHSQVLVTFLDPKTIDPVKLSQLIEQLETIEGIQQGFEQLDAGQTRPVEDFVQEMQQKYGISS